MTAPRVLIIRAPGVNCDQETEYAFRLAGGAPERVHVNRLLERPASVDEFQILCVPGGFSYGDDVAAGKILACQVERHLAEAIRRFHDAGKPILGICNGFQVLLKAGLLLADDQHGPQATLTWNDSGLFEDRWVQLGVAGESCLFLSGIERMYLPVAHAEGKVVFRDEATRRRLEAAGQLVLRYVAADGGPADYPANPNGSEAAVAGLCDATGRVLGLMPHPERFVTRTQHPRWTREPLPDEGQGLAVFRNAVEYCR